MYTSGTTGRPKGIVVSHRAVLAFTGTLGSVFGLGPGTRSIGFASLGFDASVIDILAPLRTGGAVQLAGEADRRDPARLQRFLEEHQVTWGMLPPALLPLLEPGRLGELTDILTGGEAAGPEQVIRWSADGGRRFHNLYGLTETAVCVTAAELTGSWQRPLPIGYPLPGCSVHVLDEAMCPCPPGAPGELYVGGAQLARNYAGQPGGTAGRFLPDPLGDRPGDRLFRTGDLVVRAADGCLDYLGRLDRQVKVQGQRVEMGEIEAALRSHPRVRQAAAESIDGPGGLTEIVAYLSPAGAPEVSELRAYLLQRLPVYMIPTRVIRSESLRLSASGKVDLAALRTGASSGGDQGPARPRGTPTAAGGVIAGAVALAWAEVFESAEPADDDDFFGCGGHSLTAMRLVSAVRASTGKAISVDDLFQARTAGELARRVAAAPADVDRIPAASRPALSPAQRRMWFVEQLAPGTAVHNMAFAIRLRGELDVLALKAALTALSERHEVLRWRVASADGIGEVTVSQPAVADLPVSSIARASQATSLRQFLDSEASLPLDLVAGPPWRARLIRLSDDEHVLSVVFHHLIFDGWSQGIWCRDLSATYRRAVSGAQAPPASPAATFADYVALLARQEAASGQQALRWWAEHLDGVSPVLDLPRDRPRPAVQTRRGDRRSAVMTKQTLGTLDRHCAALGVTRNAGLLTVFGIMLSRLTGQHDLIVGAPFTDRGHAEFEPEIGLFLQILPLRLRISDDEDFAEHLRRGQAELSAALPHAAAPLERIVEAAGGPRDLSRSPLIQVLFNPHAFGAPALDLPGVTSVSERPGIAGALFDLTLYVTTAGDELALEVVYNPDLYDGDRIEALLDGYLSLTADLLRREGEPIGQAAMRPPGSGLPHWRDPLPDGAAPGLVERVAELADRQPDALAVSSDELALTYSEVVAIAVRTSGAIREAGVRPGDPVAVLAGRHSALPAVLLGILRSGAWWVVVDPAHPAAVLRRQFTAAAPGAVVSFEPAGRSLAPDGVPVIEARSLTAAGPDRKADDELAPAGQQQHARGYLSLTSGTTGAPWLVRTSERPLDHFLAWYPASYGLDSTDRFAMLAGLAHDPLLRDLFTPLVLGARLCVPDPACTRDPSLLLGWLRAEQVTVAHLTPQLARLLVAASGAAGPGAGTLPALRLVILGGDQATIAELASVAALAPAARVLSGYGTTETPQLQAVYELDRSRAHRDEAWSRQPAPAGSGIEGAALMVLDPAGHPAAVGELGEVVIRSRHLASGYADQMLTKRRFGQTPGTDSADRYFRTGDLGRHLPGGQVVLAGRADRQVKIRGYRVELGEVTAVLAGHRDVSQAHVVVTGQAEQGQRLHAYVVPASAGLSPDKLLGDLRAELPGYAVPAELTMLRALPVTPNGKIDEAALPRASMRPSRTVAELSRPAERTIAGVWREVLGVPRLGPAANFFDVGGDSLTIVAVHARLTRKFDVPITVADLFRYPTIRSFADFLTGDEQDASLARAAQRAAQRRDRTRRRAARQLSKGDRP